MTMNVHSQIMSSMVKGYSPKVGDGLTLCYHSDRKCATIKEVLSEDHFTFTRDHTVADKSKECGMGHQNWIHTETNDETREHAMKGKDGRWYVAGKTPKGKLTVNGKHRMSIIVGHREYYYDWSL